MANTIGNFIGNAVNNATGQLNFNSVSDSNKARDDAFSNSGLNEEFRDQFNSLWDAYNPDSISDTFWDKFSNFFGARSSADKTRMQLEQARKEQIAQLVGLQREQEYNSETEKAKRMRAAGINPDLQGLGSASEASEMSEPEQRPDFGMLSTGRDAFSDVFNFGKSIASGFSSALTNAISLFSGIQGLREQNIDISNKEIEAAVNGADNNFSLIQSLFTPEQFYNYFHSNDNSVDSLSSFNWSDDTLKRLGIRSKRGKDLLKHFVSNYMNSFKGQMSEFKTYDDWLKSKIGYANTNGQWFMTKGADTSVKEISDSLYKWNTALHDLEVKYNSFQRTYYATLSAKKYAEAENAANTFRKFVTDKKQDLYHKLIGDKDNMFSLILATSLMGDTNVIGNGLNMISSGVGIGKHLMPGLGADNAVNLLKLGL